MIESLNSFLMFFSAILKEPIYVQVGMFSFFVVCLSAIIATINVPIINYILIPKIEKKIGRKLDFSWNFYNLIAGGNFLYRHIEIVDYIILKYLAWKFKKNQDAVRLNNVFALEKINYRIENASRFEILMCFFVAINYIAITLGLTITTAIALIYGSH